MILRIKRFIEKYFQPPETEADIEQRLKLATTALLIEMTQADLDASAEETARIREILAKHFRLNDEEIERTLTEARRENHDAADYYQFTSVINEYYSQAQKVQLVEQLWQIAWADGYIDRFEEHLVRTLADLLHVPHVRFIQAKHRVLGTD